MIKPRKLKRGDTIALVSPAGPLPGRFARQHYYITKYLAERGFSVLNYTSDSFDVTRQIALFTKAIQDSRVSAVFPLCGGELIYDFVKELPPLGNTKILVGFSEVCSLLNILSWRDRWVTLSGPHLSFINQRASKRETEYTVSNFWSVLLQEPPLRKRLDTHESHNSFSPETLHYGNLYRHSHLIKKHKRRDNQYISTSHSVITGTLVVSSLEAYLRTNSLVTLRQPDDALFLLDILDKNIDESLALLDALVTSLSEKPSGVIIASVAERTDKKQSMLAWSTDLELRKKFINRCKEILGSHVPCAFGFPYGHSAYKYVVPQGIRGEFDFTEGSLRLLESPFGDQDDTSVPSDL